jgi:Nickel responsive protein SCO4226-like
MPAGAEGRRRCRAIVDGNTDEGVTWLQSYVRGDGKTAFCIYDAPSPEALRRAAARSGLAIDRISEVRTLDPYMYVSSAISKGD